MAVTPDQVRFHSPLTDPPSDLRVPEKRAKLAMPSPIPLPGAAMDSGFGSPLTDLPALADDDDPDLQEVGPDGAAEGTAPTTAAPGQIIRDKPNESNPSDRPVPQGPPVVFGTSPARKVRPVKSQIEKQRGKSSDTGRSRVITVKARKSHSAPGRRSPSTSPVQRYDMSATDGDGQMVTIDERDDPVISMAMPLVDAAVAAESSVSLKTASASTEPIPRQDHSVPKMAASASGRTDDQPDMAMDIVADISPDDGQDNRTNGCADDEANDEAGTQIALFDGIQDYAKFSDEVEIMLLGSVETHAELRTYADSLARRFQEFEVFAQEENQANQILRLQALCEQNAQNVDRHEVQSYLLGIQSHVHEQGVILGTLESELQLAASKAIHASESEQQIVLHTQRTVESLRNEASQRHEAILDETRVAFQTTNDELSDQLLSSQNQVLSLANELSTARSDHQVHMENMEQTAREERQKGWSSARSRERKGHQA